MRVALVVSMFLATGVALAGCGGDSKSEGHAPATGEGGGSDSVGTAGSSTEAAGGAETSGARSRHSVSTADDAAAGAGGAARSSAQPGAAAARDGVDAQPGAAAGSDGDATRPGTAGSTGQDAVAALPPAPRQWCGDGLLREDEEECDDGNSIPGDGCAGDCTVERAWRCETPGEPCARESLCGNGQLDDGEACDDNNVVGGDGCSANCLYIEAGYVCAAVGEACIGSKAPSCGDGVVEPDAGESCDDGVNDGTGECAPGCVPGPLCGDGIRSVYEECDDGVNSGEYGRCGFGCMASEYCGDGIASGDEECDDGENTTVGYELYGCGPGCVLPARCGDGITQPEYGETCDDINQDELDGCSSLCQVGQCTVGTPTPHFYKGCVGDSVYWFDSCGEATDLIEACASGKICQTGGCRVDSTSCSCSCTCAYCTATSTSTCYAGAQGCTSCTDICYEVCTTDPGCGSFLSASGSCG